MIKTRETAGARVIPSIRDQILAIAEMKTSTEIRGAQVLVIIEVIGGRIRTNRTVTISSGRAVTRKEVVGIKASKARKDMVCGETGIILSMRLTAGLSLAAEIRSGKGASRTAVITCLSTEGDSIADPGT